MTVSMRSWHYRWWRLWHPEKPAEMPPSVCEYVGKSVVYLIPAAVLVVFLPVLGVAWIGDKIERVYRRRYPRMLRGVKSQHRISCPFGQVKFTD